MMQNLRALEPRQPKLAGKMGSPLDQRNRRAAIYAARKRLPAARSGQGRSRPQPRRLRRSQAITRAHKERACCFHLADDEKAPRRALRVAHCDFKQGARAGAGSEAMKPVANALSVDDMLVLAAYVASLPPHGGETK
jgi:hypothetical protein